ncbi:MAG: acetyl-CoA carboxylase biotin carboxyl carrier protein subunit [Actinophytocola sp.]|uniref:acetyl-CoA carboxylase biotin carboxyl carrier protein n=1 Tax=Actinophytocola sp. TaxID=1872138 RepID=UPI00132B6304|nr:biotin/lipoyl-containing protein [Actinophytocola sp.]MPZ85026.1 acetyl-CoA carboxylase biotin carboxyl carrier protein subunit [Actinophytocola sp.]
MTHRLPRAVHNANEHNAFDEHEAADAPQSVADVLKVVRETAADLLATSPRPPSTLNVRVGDVSVEMGWAPPAAAHAPDVAVAQVAPVVPVVAPTATSPVAAPPSGPTLNAATVGTFYRSPSPGAPPFVAEGDEVAPGQQIAIIEAMKLMLPVEAERAGRIEEVLVGDGEGVEFGQPLFRLAAAESELAA